MISLHFVKSQGAALKSEEGIRIRQVLSKSLMLREIQGGEYARKTLK